MFSSDGSALIAAVGSTITQKVVDIYSWKISNIEHSPLKGTAILSTPTVMSLHEIDNVDGMSPDKLLRIVSLDPHHIVSLRSVLHSGLHNGSSNSVYYFLQVFNIFKQNSVISDKL